MSAEKKVDQKKFDQIKKVYELSGMTQAEVAELFGLSSATISYIARFDTYKEFREFSNNRLANLKKPETKKDSTEEKLEKLEKLVLKHQEIVETIIEYILKKERAI